MTEHHIHLVSDATGETVISVAKACLVQFEDLQLIEHAWPLIRSEAQMDKVIESIESSPGIVLCTLVNSELRRVLEEGCRRLKLPFIPVLDPVIAALAGHLGTKAQGMPGLQHAMNDEYFKRIEAIQFVMNHDDGQSMNSFEDADIVVMGVSRTSKTPVCVYLANRGYKAANIPVVPDCPLPIGLTKSDGPMIVGLTSDPQRLVQIRRNRLRMLNEFEETDYVDLETVIAEVKAARRMYAKNRWPVIDVTRKSVEETAAAIIQHYTKRMEQIS
ncbi:MAG: kinase/pyrophosphorylase [Rhodospirillales bacterium]|nr:kinase/pyrophosphorylase [Rhodospirillales bacterium]